MKFNYKQSQLLQSISILFSIFLLFQICQNPIVRPLWAMSFSTPANSCHKDIWNACFGVQGSPRNRGAWYDTLKNVQDAIDKYNHSVFGQNALKIIQDTFPSFIIENYGDHRYFFHWGCWFKVQDSHSFVLKYNSDEKQQWWGKRGFRFFVTQMNRLWKIRRSAVLSRMRERFPFLTKSECEGLLTILYDIHILCDYSSSYIQPLIPLDDLLDEIINTGFNKLFGANDVISPRLNAQFYEICNKDCYIKPNDQALALINTILEDLPFLFEQYYGEDFLAYLNIMVDSSRKNQIANWYLKPK